MGRLVSDAWDMTAFFAGSPHPVREDVAEPCARAWAHLASPGTWWTGPERGAIAREVRQARVCRLCAERKAALSPYALPGEHEEAEYLPAAAVDAVHRITTDPGRLTLAWLQRTLTAGLTDAHYVELIGVVANVIIIDTLARGMGMPPPPLPEPQPGEPTRERPTGAEVHSAWIPTVVPEKAEGPLKAFYELSMSTPYVPNHPEIAGFAPNVGRALTLVPAEHFQFIAWAGPLYFGPPSLSRAQVDLVGSIVSAYNDCFY